MHTARQSGDHPGAPGVHHSAWIVPSGVALVEATTEMYDEPLAAREERAIDGAGPARRRTFRAGRACARVALTRIGVAGAVIPADGAGRPVWPSGTVGAISHCRGYCAAVAASAADFGGLGLDAERRRRVDIRLARRVCTPAELRRVTAVDDSAEWATVVFSAKEAAFKALDPLVHDVLGLTDGDVDVDRDAGTLAVRIIGGRLRGLELRGRFAVLRQVVVTALWLKPDEAAAIVDGATPRRGHEI